MNSIVDFPGVMPLKTIFEYDTLDTAVSEHALQAIATWNALRGTRSLPPRSALNPRHLAPIMQYVALMKVIDGGTDFETRIAGDEVVRTHDMPIAGRRFSAVAAEGPALLVRLLPSFRKVVRTAKPLVFSGRAGNDFLHVVCTDFAGVLLPFGEPNGEVDFVLYVGTTVQTVYPVMEEQAA